MSLEIPNDATPPNFDLRAYESASNLNLAGWYYNLKERAWLQTLLGLGEGYEDHFPRKKILENLCYLLVKPIISSPEFERKDDKQFKASPRVVRPVSLKDAMDISADVRNGFWGEDLREMGNIFNTPNSEQGFEAAEALDKHPVVISASQKKGEPLNPKAWVAVDLHSKDKEIKQSFELWLENARLNFPDYKKSSKRQRIMNEFSDTTLQSWYTKRILPYMDLMLWNEMKGNVLTDEMMGELIFPEQGESVKAKNPTDTKGSISDSVKPLVRDLLSEKIITRMGNLVLPP